MLLLDKIAQLVLPFVDQGATSTPLEAFQDAALLIDEGVVLWAGTSANFPEHYPHYKGKRLELKDQCVLPGFVDSHTHLVFAGERIDEMERRARGESYEEIAAAGGGISFSASQMAQVDQDELIKESLPRFETLLRKGTTTCEVKSGYGLNTAAELKQIEAINQVQKRHAIDVKATALAHLVPKDAQENRSAYLDEFCANVLKPSAEQGKVDYCDIFVEAGAFSPQEARIIARYAQELGLGIKLHVDQLTSGAGAELAAELGALSADHLERISDEGPEILAQANVTATILPGCKLFLGAGPWPDGRKLRDAGCEVAIATDCNPGSAMVSDLPLCATMGATLCGLSLPEALWGITRGGAKALGLDDRGTLRPGERADLVVLAHTDWRSLLYRPANPPIKSVMIAGEWVLNAP